MARPARPADRPGYRRGLRLTPQDRGHHAGRAHRPPHHPGPPADGQLADSLALANALAGLLINLAARPGATGFLDVQIGDLYFAEVHQATGYLATELDVPPAQALIRLRSHAFTHGLPLLATARAVLHHQLHLENDRP
ncbi:ANTAR domain-containing protein [Streptomyces rectiviolaceus]|uniref:ANTAR domain-containing protein n=1 Tax=Streptomyces rectiviolaceus TaxID=332591 RepID=UPI003642C991